MTVASNPVSKHPAWALTGHDPGAWAVSWSRNAGLQEGQVSALTPGGWLLFSLHLTNSRADAARPHVGASPGSCDSAPAPPPAASSLMLGHYSFQLFAVIPHLPPTFAP